MYYESSLVPVPVITRLFARNLNWANPQSDPISDTYNDQATVMSFCRVNVSVICTMVGTNQALKQELFYSLQPQREVERKKSKEKARKLESGIRKRKGK